MGLGLSNAVTSFVPVIDLNWDLQALYPSGELLNIFLFFISQPESDFIVCTQDLLLPPTSTTRHCRYHHFHQSQEQTAIELALRSSPDIVAIHVTIFVTSSFNSAMELYLSEQETEIPLWCFCRKAFNAGQLLERLNEPGLQERLLELCRTDPPRKPLPPEL